MLGPLAGIAKMVGLAIEYNRRHSVPHPASPTGADLPATYFTLLPGNTSSFRGLWSRLLGPGCGLGRAPANRSSLLDHD